MSLDYKYIVWESKKLSSKGRILDFGCGGGSVVRYGIEQDLDIVGADIFYEGNDSRREAEQSGLLGESLFEMKNGKLPFDDDEFDDSAFDDTDFADLEKEFDEIDGL